MVPHSNDDLSAIPATLPRAPEAKAPKRRRPPVRITLHVEGLSSEGAGVARHDGKVHFVPGALPGETVEAEIVTARRRFERARLVRVLEPSPDRRAPRCPHLDYC